MSKWQYKILYVTLEKVIQGLNEYSDSEDLMGQFSADNEMYVIRM